MPIVTSNRKRFVLVSLYLLILYCLPFNAGLVAASENTRNFDAILPRLIDSNNIYSPDKLKEDVAPLLEESTELIHEIFPTETEIEEFDLNTDFVMPASVDEFAHQFNLRLQPASVELMETTTYIHYLHRREVQSRLRAIELEYSDDTALQSIVDAITVSNRMAALLEMIHVVSRHRAIVSDNSYGDAVMLPFLGALGSGVGLFFTRDFIPQISGQANLHRHLMTVLEGTNVPGTSTTVLRELQAVATTDARVQLADVPEIGTYSDRQRINLISRLFADGILVETGEELVFSPTRNAVDQVLALRRTANRHLARMRRVTWPLYDSLNAIGGAQAASVADDLDQLLSSIPIDDRNIPHYRSYGNLSAEAVVRSYRLENLLTRADHMLGAVPGDSHLDVSSARRALATLQKRSGIFRNWITGRSGTRSLALAGTAVFAEVATLGFCLYHLIDMVTHNHQWSDLGGDSAEKFKKEVEAFRRTGRKSTDDLQRTLAKLNAEITGLQQLWQEAGRKLIDWPEIPPVLDLDRAMFELL